MPSGPLRCLGVAYGFELDVPFPSTNGNYVARYRYTSGNVIDATRA